ncbi:MAG: 23S rRNA (cytidine(2498)-2'-O)-methyltransferase RlmM, partial [Silvanigrellales bacterium]|nr:23S rRNA (cytidine(2498)-2'-O)-methyltransferase RlmM [Silvanigrellales bacterium]
FCRTFGPHLRKALEKNFAGFGKVASVGRDPTLPRPVALHVFFIGWNECVVALSLRGVTWPLPCGIPRLKFPSAAPSRSTLKLEEAFLTFLDDSLQARWLRAGLTAVDLGACPGGWTYQFVRREMHVTAVDNGSIAESLLSTGLVEHLREDGFRFRPRKPVAWMVCDMVEKPTRVARLAAEWILEGHASHSIFNLKLPMKARFAEVSKCLRQVESLLAESGLQKGRDYVLKCRQLFHDREEVTCYLGRIDAK